jgi:hypothetical protein
MQINLGKTCSGPKVCSPSKSSKDEPQVYYPSVYIDAPEGTSLKGLPDAGTITFRFKKTRSSVETNREDETRESVSLDLLEITDTTEETKDKVDEREAALDKLAKEEDPDDEDEAGDYE